MNRPKTLKVPTHEELLLKFEGYQKHYSALHEQQIEDDKFYELLFDAEVPSIYDERKPPSARQWVDTGVTNFTLDNPVPIFFPRSDSDAARKQVELLELLVGFILRQHIYLIKRGAKKLLKRGEVFIRLEMDDKYYGTSHPDRLFHLPLSMHFPDPINTFPSPAHDGLVPYDCFEAHSITIAKAKELADRNNWDWWSKKKDTELIPWKRYTSPHFRCFWIDNKPVLSPPVQPNLYKFCNYVHIDAGLGDDHYEGKPEYLYTSILKPLRDMFKMEAQQLSAILAIVARYSFPRWKAIGDPELVKKYYPDGVPTDPEEFIREIKDQLEVVLVKKALEFNL